MRAGDRAREWWVGGVLPVSASAVRAHVGPGWGLVGVFTVFELGKPWCAILGLNQ
ncbi:MAG: hypothetical protein QOE30_6214 [Mycobacterium sp.]|jgi:hypothetical protein|nr:hypothetical protein [Mycobacterium sp.]